MDGVLDRKSHTIDLIDSFSKSACFCELVHETVVDRRSDCDRADERNRH